MIYNKKYPDTTELMFFHATSTKYLSSFVKNGIRIPKKYTKRDFGQGFYLTSNYWQASKYADRMAFQTRTEPLIIACIIPISRLRRDIDKGLIIDQFDKTWLETIIRGRFYSDEIPLSDEYDWIYGRCGDGKTLIFEENFRKNNDNLDLNLLLKHSIPNKDFPHFEYDQLWLGTYKAINYIKSIEILNKEGVGIHEKIPIHQL
jgi:hypothetical protein